LRFVPSGGSEVQVNLAYRWFCKLGIEDHIPDHSVFCRARRERFRESDALRRVFEHVVALCISAGLVGGDAFSVDASKTTKTQKPSSAQDRHEFCNTIG
jgi:transposase